MESQNKNEKTAFPESSNVVQPPLEMKQTANPLKTPYTKPKPEGYKVILKASAYLTIVLAFLVLLATKDFSALIPITWALIALRFLSLGKQAEGPQTLKQLYTEKPGAKKAIVYGAVFSIIAIVLVVLFAVLKMPSK